MKNRDVKVVLGEEIIGRIALTESNCCAFEYTPEYIATGVSISPFKLPLRSGVFVADYRPFNGGFGVFNDSLPDGWGMLLLDRYLKTEGVDTYKLSVLDRLSLTGSSGRGALEYIPDRNVVSKSEFNSNSFNKIALECKQILDSTESEESLKTIYQMGGSSGGARPKVFVKRDGKEWLVKFCSSIDPEDTGVVEYKYSLFAKECGISMPKTKLFEDRYFGVERFDRTPSGKVHTISAAGLLNADYRIPSLDYRSLMQASMVLTRDISVGYNLFRLMAFNVLISNRDDHANNFSFQLKGESWNLSPAYDILPSVGFNGYHTTSINSQGEPTMQDLYAVGDAIQLSRVKMRAIVEEIIDKGQPEEMIKYIPKSS